MNGAFIAALLFAAPAFASHPFEMFGDDAGTAIDAGTAVPDDKQFAYLDGIGGEGRAWEITSDTAFGEDRVLTERLEVALAIKVPRLRLNVVSRVGVGFDADVTTRDYALQGMTLALGVRHISDARNFLIEAGFRLIPPWTSSSDTLPSAQRLALTATLTSGAADDARWLPIASLGLQAYVEFQARTKPCLTDHSLFSFGARYGGVASLMPISVRTWLGPEPQFLANIYLEGFFALARLLAWKTNLVAGLHADLSLSSIWPGDLPFPLVGNLFFGWSPTNAVLLRLYAGWGGSLGAPETGQLQYGLRLQVYLP